MADFLTFAGLLQDTTSTFLRRKDQLVLSINVHGDEIGSLTQRLGYTQAGSTLEAAQSVTGMHSYNDVSGATQYLFAFINGAIKYYNGSSWADAQSVTPAGAQMEFRVFLDQLFLCGANSSNQYLTTANIDGVTYSGTRNVTNAPNARYIEVFRDRVYLADVSVGGVRYPDRFYYSSLPDTNGTAITWTSTNFERVYTNNGEPIKGLHTNKTLRQLLIFKENSLHAWDTTSLQDVGNVGTSAHRSIKSVNYITFFFNEDGIYAYTGSEPQLISRPIQKWIKGIDQTKLGDVFAEVDSKQYYKLYVGTITVDGVAYSNCEIRYSIPDNTFTIYSYADTFTSYAQHRISGKTRIYAGTNDGEVHKLGAKDDTDYSDNTTPISSQFMFETDLGLPSERKKVDSALIYTTNPQNLTGRVRVKNKDWSSYFAINEQEQEVFVNPEDGRILQWHFAASQSVAPFIFEGMTFTPRLTTQKYV
jgi:hypothetical protein